MASEEEPINPYDDDFHGELNVIFMNSRFDYNAALNATPDEARLKLKMIKHYVRALHGDEGVNGIVKDLLLKFGIDPSLPYDVVGGFSAIIEILKDLHKCELKKKQAKRRATLKKKEAKAKKAQRRGKT